MTHMLSQMTLTVSTLHNEEIFFWIDGEIQEEINITTCDLIRYCNANRANDPKILWHESDPNY